MSATKSKDTSAKAWGRYYRALDRIESTRRMNEQKAHDRLVADLKAIEEDAK